MIQRGEPATYLSLLIVAVIFGVSIFLGVATGDVTVTGATVGSNGGSPLSSGTGGVGFVLGVIVFCVVAIAALEFGRK